SMQSLSLLQLHQLILLLESFFLFLNIQLLIIIHYLTRLIILLITLKHYSMTCFSDFISWNFNLFLLCLFFYFYNNRFFCFFFYYTLLFFYTFICRIYIF